MKNFSEQFRKIAGPAAVMAAASIGAGSASSLILSGAWYCPPSCPEFGYQDA